MTYKTVLILIFLCVAQCGYNLVSAQEKYTYVVEIKKKEIRIKDDLGSDFAITDAGFTFRGRAIAVSREGRRVILSDSSGVIGHAPSKRFKKVVMADGTVYTLKWKKGVQYYLVDGAIKESASYFIDENVMSRNRRIYVETTSNNPDFMPFQFLSAQKHIRRMRDREHVAYALFLL